MTSNGHTVARQLRRRLTHPVVDADGHWIEYTPVMREAFRKNFMFANAVRFWGQVNPDFFAGTVVAKAAAEVLAEG